MTTDEYLEYQALIRLAEGAITSQRHFAESLGISLGKANHVVRALVVRGLVKVENAKGNPSRLGYVYLLTPQGIVEKARLTHHFLKRKLEEYDQLQKEILKFLPVRQGLRTSARSQDNG